MKLSEDVELKYIARRLGGYSGADITNVCRDASMMSMRRKIAGLKPSEIRNLDKDELDLPVTKQDFLDAVAKCNKSVSREDLDKTGAWAENGDCGMRTVDTNLSILANVRDGECHCSPLAQLLLRGEERSPPFEKSKRSLVGLDVVCELFLWPPLSRWSVFNC